MQAGGMPDILPYLVEDMDVQQIAMSNDGLYMTGGDDIDPTYFGEEPHRNLGPIIPARDVFEVKITKEILRQKKPILGDRKSTRLNSSHVAISYAVFCLKKKKKQKRTNEKCLETHT